MRSGRSPACSTSATAPNCAPEEQAEHDEALRRAVLRLWQNAHAAAGQARR
jgi:hypothetical protein